MKELARFIAVKTGKLLRRIGVTLPESIFRHLHFKGPFTIDLPTDKKLRIYSWGNRVENELYWLGLSGHESDERQAWIQMVREDGDILDIGANTGTYAFMAKAISPASRVFAFEPIDRIADKIFQNIEVSGLQVQVERTAMSDEPGQIPIYDPGGENAYSASLESDFLAGDKESYLVPVTSIDTYCFANNLDPVAIKIDVEGSEGKVLLGARKTLEKRRVAILCEWLGSTDSHLKAIELLRENGYVALDVINHEPVDLGTQKSFETRNLLLVPA